MIGQQFRIYVRSYDGQRRSEVQVFHGAIHGTRRSVTL